MSANSPYAQMREYIKKRLLIEKKYKEHNKVTKESEIEI